VNSRSSIQDLPDLQWNSQNPTKDAVRDVWALADPDSVFAAERKETPRDTQVIRDLRRAGRQAVAAPGFETRIIR
jgi:hypothetical protein